MIEECLVGRRDNVEELRDEETMLSGFTRLQEITGDNLCPFTHGLSDPDSD